MRHFGACGKRRGARIVNKTARAVGVGEQRRVGFSVGAQKLSPKEKLERES